MHFTGNIYRPPDEAMLDAKLLQVTVGCSHNTCRFCNMYQNIKFQIEPIEQIEEDIKELRQTYSNIKRIFLVNGDPLSLSRKYLQEITDKIIAYIPEIEVISMYASIQNLKHKSDEDLEKIKEMRINDLWFGMETGHKDHLAFINKGHTLEDAYNELERLNKIGIRHNHCYILGVGGKGKGIENAIDTAKLINTTKPSIVWCGSLGIFQGTGLSKDRAKGEFTPATELEILEEEIKLIELIELKSGRFNGLHPTNVVAVHGLFPAYKNVMIQEIKDNIKYLSKDFLHSSMQRKVD